MLFGFILCASLKYCTTECHLLVWRKSSAAFPPPIKLLSLAVMYLSFFQHPPPHLPSAVGRSRVHHPLLSEHWAGGATDHNGWPIISSKGGWGVRRRERLWGWGLGGGSIYQSVSNEGKNWSKSSRWKSCSAWGGLSVSRISDFRCCFVQQHPNRGMTAIAMYWSYSSIHNICCILCLHSVSRMLSWSTFSAYFIHH